MKKIRDTARSALIRAALDHPEEDVKSFDRARQVLDGHLTSLEPSVQNQLQVDDQVTEVAFAPEGDDIYFVTTGKMARLWQWQARRPVAIASGSRITLCGFVGNTLAYQLENDGQQQLVCDERTMTVPTDSEPIIWLAGDRTLVAYKVRDADHNERILVFDFTDQETKKVTEVGETPRLTTLGAHGFIVINKRVSWPFMFTWFNKDGAVHCQGQLGPEKHYWQEMEVVGPDRNGHLWLTEGKDSDLESDQCVFEIAPGIKNPTKVIGEDEKSWVILMAGEAWLWSARLYGNRVGGQKIHLGFFDETGRHPVKTPENDPYGRVDNCFKPTSLGSDLVFQYRLGNNRYQIIAVSKDRKTRLVCASETGWLVIDDNEYHDQYIACVDSGNTRLLIIKKGPDGVLTTIETRLLCSVNHLQFFPDRICGYQAVGNTLHIIEIKV